MTRKDDIEQALDMLREAQTLVMNAMIVLAAAVKTRYSVGLAGVDPERRREIARAGNKAMNKGRGTAVKKKSGNGRRGPRVKRVARGVSGRDGAE
jgi:hypothetical protein